VKAGVPLVAWLISHQRIPATDPELTVRFPTSASWPSANRRYASRNIGRLARLSRRSVVPSCGTPADSVVNPAGTGLPPSVKVLLAGVVQST